MASSATKTPNDPLSLPLDGVSLPVSLEDARISALPPTAYYIPNFLSEDEERLILDKVLKRLAWNALTALCLV